MAIYDEVANVFLQSPLKTKRPFTRFTPSPVPTLPRSHRLCQANVHIWSPIFLALKCLALHSLAASPQTQASLFQDAHGMRGQKISLDFGFRKSLQNIHSWKGISAKVLTAVPGQAVRATETRRGDELRCVCLSFLFVSLLGGDRVRRHFKGYHLFWLSDSGNVQLSSTVRRRRRCKGTCPRRSVCRGARS